MNRYISLLAGLVLALVAVGLAQSAPGDRPKLAYVVAGDAAERPAVVSRVRSLAARDGAQLRVLQTTADQLGVTHLLAASGYDKVITLGVDRRIAIAPVAARFPDTRFVELPG